MSHFFENAGAGGIHLNPDLAITCRPRGDRQIASCRVFHRLDRIADQIDRHLLDLDLVREYEVDLRIKIERYAHFFFLCADELQKPFRPWQPAARPGRAPTVAPASGPQFPASSVRSRITPAKNRRLPKRISPTASSMGKVEPPCAARSQPDQLEEGAASPS